MQNLGVDVAQGLQCILLQVVFHGLDQVGHACDCTSEHLHFLLGFGGGHDDGFVEREQLFLLRH